MQSNKRKSSINTPKTKRTQLNETSVLQSSSSSLSDEFEKITSPRSVTFKDVTQGSSTHTNSIIAKTKKSKLSVMIAFGKRSIRSMFSHKVVHETNPIINEPFSPSPTFDDPFLPTPKIESSSKYCHISEYEQLFLKLLAGVKLNDLKTVQVNYLRI